MEHSQSQYLVCIDGSEVARKAMRFACIKARKRNLIVDLLHIVPPIEKQSLESVQEAMEAELRADAEKMMQDHAEEAKSLSGHTPSILIRHGDIVDEIIAQTNETENANMLVLGIEPEKGSRGRLVSKITAHMGHKLLIPIMLVPATLTDEQMEEIG